MLALNGYAIDGVYSLALEMVDCVWDLSRDALSHLAWTWMSFCLLGVAIAFPSLYADVDRS